MTEKLKEKKKGDDKGNSKRLEEIKEKLKKEKNVVETIRTLIFKDGVCVSSSDQDDKDKIILDSKKYIDFNYF